MVAKSSSEKPAAPKQVSKKASAEKPAQRFTKAKGKTDPTKANPDKRTGAGGSKNSSAAANDWFKSNGPNRRTARPSNGKSGVAKLKTRSPKRK